MSGSKELTYGEKLNLCQEECGRYNKAYYGEERDIFHCPKCLDKGRVLNPKWETLYNDFIAVLYPCRCGKAKFYGHSLEYDIPESFINESLNDS